MSGSGPPALSPRESAILTRFRSRKERATVSDPTRADEVHQGAGELVSPGSVRGIEELPTADSSRSEPDRRERRGRIEWAGTPKRVGRAALIWVVGEGERGKDSPPQRTGVTSPNERTPFANATSGSSPRFATVSPPGILGIDLRCASLPLPALHLKPTGVGAFHDCASPVLRVVRIPGRAPSPEADDEPAPEAFAEPRPPASFPFLPARNRPVGIGPVFTRLPRRSHGISGGNSPSSMRRYAASTERVSISRSRPGRTTSNHGSPA